MTPEEFFLKSPVFRTQDFATAVGMRRDSSSRFLSSRASSGFLTRVTRGVWANLQHPEFSAQAVVPYVLGNEQGYVSFLSALHRHGVISQIPRTIFVATTGHTRRLQSPVGTYEFVQLKPKYLHMGTASIEWRSGYAMATAAKALLDCLYVSTRKGRRFSSFPELDLGSIDHKAFKRLVRAHRFPQAISTKILSSFEDLRAG